MNREFRLNLFIVLCSVLQISGLACLIFVKLLVPPLTGNTLNLFMIIVAISGFAAVAKELVSERITIWGTTAAFAGTGLIMFSIVS